MKVSSKHPDNIEPYFLVWCSLDGTNNGSKKDKGELQGSTISTSTWTIPPGITKESDNVLAVTIEAVKYNVNTVATIELSGGTSGQKYTLTNKITTSDNRTLNDVIIISIS